MMADGYERSTPTTLERLSYVQSSIKRTLATVYRNLSRLKGRSIAEYVNEDGAPTFFTRVFTSEDQKSIESGVAPEQMSPKLLFKLCKYACGLKSYNDPAWNTASNSLEYHLSFVESERQLLEEAAAFSDNDLNERLNCLQIHLEMILTEIEERAEIDLHDIKQEVLKAPQKMEEQYYKIRNYDNTLYVCCMLKQNITHKLFVMLYTNMNQLGGLTIEDYLKRTFGIRNPMIAFKPKERLILNDENTNAVQLSINLLYKLLQRVCGLPWHNEKDWNTETNSMAYLINCMKREHDKLVTEQNHEEQCYRLYEILKKILVKFSNQENSDMVSILKRIPEEPLCTYKALQPLHQNSIAEITYIPSQIKKHHDEQEAQSQSHYLSDTVVVSETGQPLVNTSQNKQEIEDKGVIPSHQAQGQCRLTVDEINVACLFKALRREGPAAKALALVYTTLSGDIRHLSDTRLKKIFTADERLKIKGDVNKLDITTLYKMIRSGCGLAPSDDPVWTTKSSAFEYRLYTVKECRNDMAHELLVLSNEDLKTRIYELESVLEAILTEASHRSGKDLQSEIAQMKDEMESLSISPTLSQNVGECYENLKKLRMELTNHIMISARNKLKNQYRQCSTFYSSPVTWSFHPQHKRLNIDKVFTDLKIVDAITNEQNSLESVLLLQRKGQQQTSSTVIIQGIAGVGKTSLCQYITYLWYDDSQKIEGLKMMDLVILIRCKYVTSNELISHLKNVMPDTFTDIDKDDIIPLMRSFKVLFLVDGYDEAGPKAKELVEDIIKSLPESRMFITCRPEFVSRLQSRLCAVSSSCNTVFTVKGFSKSNCKEYAKKLFNAITARESEEDPSFLKLLNYTDSLSGRFQALTKLPLTMGLLVLLWLDDEKSTREAQTITELYWKLTKYLLKRLEERLHLSEYRPCHQWMLTLGKISWKNLKENKLLLSDVDVEKLERKGSALGINGKEALSSLLQCDSKVSLTETNDVWTFTHKCQQEYLSAEDIVDEIIMNDKSLLEALGIERGSQSLRNYVQVIEFVAGLLSIKEELTKPRVNEIIAMLSIQESWSFEAIHRIASDLGKNNPLLLTSLKRMFKGEELITFLDGFNPLGLHWIIENTSVIVPSAITLRNSVDAVLKMDTLLQLLQSKSCYVKVIVAIDNYLEAAKIVGHNTNTSLKGVQFIYSIWGTHSLKVIVRDAWPHAKSLHVCFPVSVFPLLLWEFMIYLAQSPCKPAILEYSDNSARISTLVQEGARILNVEHSLSSAVDTGGILISNDFAYLTTHSA